MHSARNLTKKERQHFLFLEFLWVGGVYKFSDSLKWCRRTEQVLIDFSRFVFALLREKVIDNLPRWIGRESGHCFPLYRMINYYLNLILCNLRNTVDNGSVEYPLNQPIVINISFHPIFMLVILHTKVAFLCIWIDTDCLIVVRF